MRSKHVGQQKVRYNGRRHNCYRICATFPILRLRNGPSAWPKVGAPVHSASALWHQVSTSLNVGGLDAMQHGNTTLEVPRQMHTMSGAGDDTGSVYSWGDEVALGRSNASSLVDFDSKSYR